MTKKIYHFVQGEAEGNDSMVELLGGKGANLAQMCALNLPVPPGFTITTLECNNFYKNNQQIDESLKQEVLSAITCLEKIMGKKFGDSVNPLLVSIRSGSRKSMPGMMDTILNLGIGEHNIDALAKIHGMAFALDSYRRFLQMYSEVVLNIPARNFDEIRIELRLSLNLKHDDDIPEANLRQLIELYLKEIHRVSGQPFPVDLNTQLFSAIKMVFISWTNKRAKIYRQIHNIPESYGTAINIQAMVFGNTGQNSGTGVVFTRNPSSGENKIYGEYLLNAQGEDVVAGTKTPHPIISETQKELTLEYKMPKIFAELKNILTTLEIYYKDSQDVEFTIEEGKLWLLQTRDAKRAPAAMIKIAHDMAQEKIITIPEAVMRIDCKAAEKLLHPQIAQKHSYKSIAKGLAASPGVASGMICLSAEKARDAYHKGYSVILVRHETNPEDIEGMNLAKGILTAKGGTTSHAAVVARGMGKCCITGCEMMNIDYNKKQISFGDIILKEDEIITLDGCTGEIILGEAPLILPQFSQEFDQIIAWAKDIKALKVHANAETVKDIETALKFGAEGIGLCRTEHMFFEKNRLIQFRTMILASDAKVKNQALAKLFEMQLEDFKNLFNLLNGLPINIRLLDPPLHEFLPYTESDKDEFAKTSNLSRKDIEIRTHYLHEVNPMLGHRGARLGITFPEIYQMQINAIFEGFAQTIGSNSPKLEIMLPLIIEEKELALLKNMVDETHAEVEKKYSIKIPYKLGTMLETPRSCILAESLAKYVDYFSFGTNDLTQTTWAISRDDAVKFLPTYLEKHLIEADPFVNIDIQGVGELIKIAVQNGKQGNQNVTFGVCGEHAGDAKSIRFFHNAKLDYISCSPYRISIAHIAAAQAKLTEGQNLVSESKYL